MPQSELLATLYEVVPKFQNVWEGDCTDDPFPSDSLHTVYLSLLPFLSVEPLSEAQLRRLCAIINAEVEKGGTAENAVSTCMLEHLGQVRLAKSLRPWLSKEARRRVRT